MSKGLALLRLTLLPLAPVGSVRALMLAATECEGEKSQTSSVTLKARGIV